MKKRSRESENDDMKSEVLKSSFHEFEWKKVVKAEKKKPREPESENDHMISGILKS